VHDVCPQNPSAPQEKSTGQVPSPGTQLFWHCWRRLQPWFDGQSLLARQPATQIKVLEQKQYVLGAGSQISLPSLAPASAAQSVSLPQLPVPCLHVPQPRNSPGARHVRAPPGPQGDRHHGKVASRGSRGVAELRRERRARFARGGDGGDDRGQQAARLRSCARGGRRRSGV